MKQSQRSIACMRSLVIDMINQANSGHPGMALGSAPILYTLFTRHVKADPRHPEWINRDRFVLSSGHASSLLYTTLHLAGYEITMEDLKKFRQLGSLTPGHPEFHHTKGVDATSGPLGQGISQAVGMAVAEQSLQAMHTNGKTLFDHYTYCLCGDGCLQEGISQEAISFAGVQKLNKLILFYDSNAVTLDGALSLSFAEDTKKRFESALWNVLEVKDGNDVEAIDEAILKAKAQTEKPTLIIVSTIIGFGSTHQGTSKVHGSPLGKEDGAIAKASYGYKTEEFFVEENVYEDFQSSFIHRGEEAYAAWMAKYNTYKKQYPMDAAKIETTIEHTVAPYVYDKNPAYAVSFQEATRDTSGNLLNILHQRVFNLFGGSADVASSVKTKIKNEPFFSKEHREGRSVNFGIRELAMASIQNGILLHGGMRTYVGCFLVFADYVKPALRLAALSNLPAIYLFSHDSIAVGEDGPTHQPIEQLAMLRSTPNVEVFRPCDAVETAEAWKLALLQTDHPCCIILTRQNLPVLPGTASEDKAKGGYIVSKERGSTPHMTLIASGSEVALAVEAQQELLTVGIDVRVVSMLSMERFFAQDPTYIQSTLGVSYEKRFAIEMLSTFGWHKLAPHVMGIDGFGASGNAKDVIRHFKFTKEEVVRRIREIL